MKPCSEKRAWPLLLHFRSRSFLVGFMLALAWVSTAQAAWFNSAWKYRVPINVPAGASINSTVKVNVDFTALLATLSVAGTFDANSPRIVRPDDSLATTQEFTDAVYADATDATNNGRGEVRFLLQDAGPETYYLYFDIVANGPKAANPQTPINGNLERGGAGTATPPGWTASTRSNAAMDIQIRPSETLNVTDTGGSGLTSSTDGTPNTGQFSYLIGYRTNPDTASSNATLTKDFTVPASSPGNINIRIKPQGWDSAVNGNVTQYDFIRVRLINPATSAVLLNIAGPQLNNYATCPFSPNYRTAAITNTTPGFGLYNYWDNGRNSNNHTLGMSAAYNRGLQPWTDCSVSLAAVAGQSVRLEIRTDIFNQYRTWFLIDDVEWSVVAAALGTPEAAASFNHLRIEHSGSGVTCTPATLTVKACADASCSSLYTGGVTGALTATGTPTVNWVGGASFTIGAGGSVTKQVQVTTVGTVTWGTTGLMPVPGNATSCYVGAPSSCAFTSALAAFIFDVPDHYADVAQSVTVSAVRQSDNSLACTPAFTGTRTINFNCGYSNPASGTLPVTVGSSTIACGSAGGLSLTFDATGVATTTVRYADVGQMSLTASYTGSGDEAGLVMTGSDPFIAAPHSFAVAPSGPYVAGVPFGVTVTARNFSGGTTPNFGQESTPAGVTLTHALTGPLGGNPGSFNGSVGAFSLGVASGSNLVWNEVGDIDVIATLTGTSYLGSGLSATGSGPAGAFRPAYFTTAVTPGAGTFTYSGQPFGVTVTAMGAGGSATQNYQGAYAKEVTLTDANSATNNSGSLGAFSNATVAAASFTDGVATATTIKYDFTTKTTAPLETPTSAPLALRATDVDGVSSDGHDEGTTPIRSGRLRLINAYGSELLRPRVEYRAEYWNGTRWMTNTDDSSSGIAANNVAITTGGSAVYGSPTFGNGVGFITFNTAGAGSYDIALNLGATGGDASCNAAGFPAATEGANMPWLRGYWSGSCNSIPAWQQDPNARIRLGSPKAPYIYLRERY